MGDLEDDTKENEEEQDDENNTNSETDKENRISLKACDLKVEAKSNEADFDEMMESCSQEMKDIMEYHLYGEYQEIEKKNGIHALLGDE